MEFTKSKFGETASQVTITADNDLEAEGIELTLKYGFMMTGGYIKSSKNGMVTYTIYPKAAKKQFKVFNWRKLQNAVQMYVNNPEKEDLGQGLETQI